jgi:REase_AHJR-like
MSIICRNRPWMYRNRSCTAMTAKSGRRRSRISKSRRRSRSLESPRSSSKRSKQAHNSCTSVSRIQQTLSHFRSDATDTEQRLDQVADRYREQGYQVVTRPGPDDLPAFAKDFKVEIVATRQDGGVLVSARASTAEFEADLELSKYAEIIEKHPDWRYDVFVLGPPPLPPCRHAANEATEAEINRALDDADKLLQAGYIPQSVIAAWAAAESAMRHGLRSQGSQVGWGTPPRTMLNELVSSGMLSGSNFRKLEDMSHLRNVIVHGFSVADIDPGVVPFLKSAARQLVTESNSAQHARNLCATSRGSASKAPISTRC